MEIFLDMDGVLTRFFEKEDCLERMYEKNFFLELNAYSQFVKSVKLFSKKNPNVEIFILSISIGKQSTTEKKAWINKYLSFIPEENILVFESGNYKKPEFAEFFLGRRLSQDDVLIDDYTDNLIQWKNYGGRAIKAINDINDKGLKGPQWDGEKIDIFDIDSLEELFQKNKGGK